MASPIRAELRALIRLAIPLAAAQAGTQMMSFVDTAVVGRLGATELGSVGLGNAFFFAISVIGMGIVMAIDPLTSQAFGANDPLQARRYLWQGVWLSLIVGGVLSIPLFASPMLLARMDIHPAIVRSSTVYILIRTLSLVPVLLYLVVRSYLQAKGRTRPIVLAMVVGNVFNLVFDILLVFGGGVLPEWAGPLRRIPALGVAGAAITSVVASVVQLLIIIMGVERLAGIQGTDRLHAPIRREIRHAFRIGLPVGLQWGAEVGIFALVGLLAARIGERDLAAHQVAITIIATTFTVAMGIGAAGSVRVGRAIGALDAAGTRRAGLVAFGSGAAFMAFCSLLFLIFPRALASLLSNQEDVLSVAVPLLAVAAVFQISDGVQAIGAGVLRGSGDTRYAFYANIFGHWVIGFPVAFLFGFVLQRGIVGLWWGLCAGLTVVALLLLLRFIRTSSRPITPIVRIAGP